MPAGAPPSVANLFSHGYLAVDLFFEAMPGSAGPRVPTITEWQYFDGKRWRDMSVNRAESDTRRLSFGSHPGIEKQIVNVLQPLPFRTGRIGADELVQIRVAVHDSSPSSSDARCARALRVRVFTVPSGRWRYSATSLCDRPLQ